MKRLGLLLLSTLLFGTATAQTAYTLDSCKKMARSQNLAIENKRLSAQMQRQVKKAAFTKYFPSVSANGTGFWLTHSMVDMNFDLGRFEPPYFNPFSYGINLPAIPIQMMNGGMLGSVTAVQPLFAGGRIVRGNKLAKLACQAADLQVQLTEEEVDTQVETYFWKIVSLQEKQKMLAVMDSLLARVTTDVTAAVNAGVLQPTDQLQVELKRQELAMGKLKVENGIRVCKMMLRQYARIPEKEFTILYDTLFTPPAPDTYFIAANEAVNQRIEKQLLDIQVAANELQTKMEVGKYLPQVAVGAGYSAYLMDVNQNNQPTNHFGMVFGTVSVPISEWWEAGHAIKKCRLQEQIARNEREQNVQLLQVQVEQSWNELYEAYQQLCIAERAQELAQENFRLQADHYTAGTITLATLLQAQTLWQQSSDTYTEAYTDYILKQRLYLKRTGQ